ncbi:MAG TPA: tripartite tricarboxylate transporter substrate-binding protein, partial [Myxococcales bacterium]|nr:tripartite tricarboxylate transporter substrate-binding protein [Myxococcales bacterium]
EPGYDAERDFEPVSVVAFQPNLIVVNASSPAKTLAELFAEAKGKKLPYASPGTGTSAHLTAEYLFKVLAKVDMFPVHFRGAGPAVAALVAGDPAVGSLGVAGPLAQIKAGKLRALAVSSKKRVPPLPDVPTLAEAGFPGAEFDLWIAVFLPARTPAPVVARMSGGIDDALHAPAIQERLQALAFEPGGGSAGEASAYVKAEIAKWRRVVQETGAKPD